MTERYSRFLSMATHSYGNGLELVAVLDDTGRIFPANEYLLDLRIQSASSAKISAGFRDQVVNSANDAIKAFTEARAEIQAGKKSLSDFQEWYKLYPTRERNEIDGRHFFQLAPHPRG